jgi:hypothetical protein
MDAPVMLGRAVILLNNRTNEVGRLGDIGGRRIIAHDDLSSKDWWCRYLVGASNAPFSKWFNSVFVDYLGTPRSTRRHRGFAIPGCAKTLARWHYSYTPECCNPAALLRRAFANTVRRVVGRHPCSGVPAGRPNATGISTFRLLLQRTGKTPFFGDSATCGTGVDGRGLPAGNAYFRHPSPRWAHSSTSPFPFASRILLVGWL